MLASKPPRLSPDHPHVCMPRMADLIDTKASCMECGRQLVRILHFPGHVIAGTLCLYPDSWQHCFISAELDENASSDLLTIPDWQRD